MFDTVAAYRIHIWAIHILNIAKVICMVRVRSYTTKFQQNNTWKDY